MVLSFTVKGLWGRQDYHFANFNPDINIITGDNGSGKTTLIKLMWYMMSGHLRLALTEIVFDEAQLVTNSAIVTLKKRKIERKDEHPRDKSPLWGRIEKVAEIHMKKQDGTNIFSIWPIPMSEINFILNEEAPAMAADTLFFPTFRRIESNLNEKTIIEGFREYANKMTHRGHKYVVTADFQDIEALLNSISSNVRAKLKPHEESFTKFISEKSGNTKMEVFTRQLEVRLKELNQKRDEYNRPLNLISQYIDRFFLEKNVKVSDDLIIGNRSGVPSVWLGDLSAGEKNLLSFILYAFDINRSQKGIMFIDEPELTFHIDWQRHLLSVLTEIAPGVQFFVVTHAPAIVASYSEKEFWLNENAVIA